MSITDSPPRAPPAKYKTPLGTRWQKEKASAERGAFEYPEDAKYVGPWIIGECVGKGASGHVKIAKHRRTGQLAAVKILPLQPFVNSRTSAESQAKSEKQRLGIDREITMMKLMDHPNIMRIYDVYEGDKELYLILEYVEGGELFDFLVNRGKLAPLEALGYFKQIVYGLNYAHTFSIIHRDLKPENILIHSLSPPLVKIADWGMAAFAPPTLQLETSCGSPHYASPEIVNGYKYTGTATDIWSCGVILFALLTGRLPFDDKNVRTLLGKVKSGKYEIPQYVDPLARDLLSRMLVVDVSKRISMTDILNHPWLESVTPGIIYVPAPPVDELAKPLPSALHINRDIFESICVIWGRHANAEAIKIDLLSPAGQGTLAKAFYFLLHKHREKAMEEHGILMDINEVLQSQGKVVTKQYAAPRARAKTLHLTAQSEHSGYQRIRSSRAAPPAPSRTPSPQPVPIRIPAPVPMEKAPSRPHPPSPIGPRPQRPRPTSSPPAASRTSYSSVPPPVMRPAAHSEYGRSYGPRLHDSMPPQASPLPSPPVNPIVRRSAAPAMERTKAAMSASGHVRTNYLPFGAPSTPAAAIASSAGTPPSNVILAPTPVAATTPSILPMITAPKVHDAELQRTFDHYASMVNNHAATYNASVTREQVQPNPEHARSRCDLPLNLQESRKEQITQDELDEMDISWPSEDSSRHGEDKENVSMGQGTSSRRQSQTDSSGGLGFGASVPMNREMGNTLYVKESPSKDHKKERKNRPSPLDFGSPNPTMKRLTPLMSPPLTSPAVGEFKGWFSNLFHWKVQSHILYSMNDVVTTRNEAARILESFGVIIALEDNQTTSSLKCRLDDVYDGHNLVQKQTRFRVDFAPVSTTNPPWGQATTAPGSTPRMIQSPMSPLTTSSAATPAPSATKNRAIIDQLNAYETAITFIMDKGAVSTFKLIFQRLKMEWTLDSLQSPRSLVANGLSHVGIEQRV
ncbi:hypothetical protein ABKN59_006462 [Abortiporus biennis]